MSSIPSRGRTLPPPTGITESPVSPEPKHSTDPQPQRPNRSSGQSSLIQNVKSLSWLLESSADGMLNTMEASQLFNICRRRINEFTNILEGAELLVKTSKYTYQWMGSHWKTKLQREVQILERQEEKLDELIKTALEQVYHMCEDEISEKFLYLSYEDVKTIPSLMDQTVIVVKAPAETVVEVPHPAESLQLFLKSTQGPIGVYLCSADHSPSDVPDHHHDDHHDKCQAERSTEESAAEPPQALCLLSASSTDAVDNWSGAAVTAEHAPPLAAWSDPPAPSSPLASSPRAPPGRHSLSSDGEEMQSFATLTTPLALSLGGEEYLLSLGEDEDISDLFSPNELDGGLWKCLISDAPPP